jgi:predicted dithiol-disulfide oxidoreductase (DUF899 family)
MAKHAVVSHDQWVEARKKHLADEKELTRARDRLSQARRDLPWERVDKDYVFEGPRGRATLAEMFDGRSQLVVYHAMFNPETASEHTTYTKDAPCFVCSWWMDNFERIVVHLNHHDVTMAAVSLAPYPKLAAYHKRMGWTFPWYSSAGSDFNFDYHVSFTPEQLEAGEVEYNYRPQRASMTELPGVSVFLRDGKDVYHTYSTYERGLDMLNVAYHYLDITPWGRNEGENGAMWVHRRDEYPD